MTRIRALFALFMIVAALGAVPRTQAAPPHCWADHLTCVTPTGTPSPTDTPTPSPTATSSPGATMATVTKTFVFASTAESWTSIGALASGETNGLDTANGNPADALFAKLVGKSKASTGSAGLKISGALGSFWGVPAGAIVTGVTLTLDKKCISALGATLGAGSFQTKLNLNAGASTNTGPTQTLPTTADAGWTNLGSGSNAALSGLSVSTLTQTLELDILYSLSTTASATTTSTWQIDWDNVAVTITYLTPDITFVQAATPVGSQLGTLSASLSGITVGNPLIVSAFGTSNLAISDTAGNSWIPGPASPSDGSGGQTVLWYAVGAASTSTTVTVTSDHYVEMTLAEYHVATAGNQISLDASGAGDNSPSSSTSYTVSTSGGTATGNELVVSAAGNNASSVATPTGYTQRGTDVPGFFPWKSVDAQIYVTGTQSATWSDLATWWAVIATFRSVATPLPPAPATTLQAVTRAAFY